MPLPKRYCPLPPGRMASDDLMAMAAHSALGMVETVGLVPAIAAADAAVKMAEVRLIGLEYIGSGLVSVKMEGDVSAVQAAVEAALIGARKLGSVHSHSVIARTGEGLCGLLRKPEPVEAETTAGKIEDVPQKVRAAEELQAMAVTRLRRLARSIEGFPLSRQKIKFARKEELIELLVAHYQQFEKE